MRVNITLRALSVAALMAAFILPAGMVWADPPYSYYDRGYPYERPLLHNPIIRQSLIGAGVGAVTGAVSRDGSLVRSAGVGAVTGAATGAIDYTGVLDGRPMVRRAAKGAVIGTGASAAMRRDKLKGAVVGAGAGAAYHLIKGRYY
ncbi:MAG: hypothetical protein IPK79_03070 [Vampirovibrionales bacterium]|nr:hypothetical protein [Vampirovibrionales bacterium]